MKKGQKLEKIVQLVNENGSISIQEITELFNVSSMTARRWLKELDDNNELIKIHSGAESKRLRVEKSQSEKLLLNIKEKKELAKLAASYIVPGDTIFIGSGTTLEHFAAEITQEDIRVVTNSLPVFMILNQKKLKDLILVAGSYRERTGAFVGRVTLNGLEALQFTKSFVSCNGIYENSISTFTESIGEVQTVALDKSQYKFLLTDRTKFNKIDFYQFYDLKDIDYLITDHLMSEKDFQKYSELTKVIRGSNQ